VARPDLPDADQSLRLAQWLAGPRGRLLRRAQIGRRRRVLEVGCGHGFVTQELVRRCPGQVIAIDREFGDMTRFASSRIGIVSPNSRAPRLIQADAAALPFADSSLDLVLFQNTLLWIADPQAAVAEAARTLASSGCLLAIEPDFGGMIEHPPDVALQDVWLRALSACGADPLIGRKLPGLCERAGLEVWVELQQMPRDAGPAAMRLLDDVPLAPEDRARVEETERAVSRRTGTWEVFIHVPYFLIVATKPPGRAM